MTEVFTVLTEVIRDNFRNAKLKQHLLPALGEFLFYAATQEENLGCEISQWDIPGNVCIGGLLYSESGLIHCHCAKFFLTFYYFMSHLLVEGFFPLASLLRLTQIRTKT